MKNIIPLSAIALLLPIELMGAEVRSDPAASHAAVAKLEACFARNYQPGVDTSADGGQSAVRLLTTCSAEWDAAAKACSVGGASTLENCNVNTGMLAGAFIQLKEAGAN